MDENADAGRGQGCAVEIEEAVQLRPSGEVGIEAGTAQEVESEYGLGDKAIPQVQGEGFVDTAEASDEMILEGADGAFSGVATMDARRSKLEVDVFAAEEVLERFRALVVQALELGAVTGSAEAGMENFEPARMEGPERVLMGSARMQLLS